jgi:hypothetical protein
MESDDQKNQRVLDSVLWKPSCQHKIPLRPEPPIITNCQNRQPRTHKLFIASPKIPEGPNARNIPLENYIRAGETSMMQDKKSHHVNSLERELDIKPKYADEHYDDYVKMLNFHEPHFSHLRKSSPG